MLFYRNILNNQQNTVKALAIAAAKGIESGAVAGAGMMDAYLDSIMQNAKRKSQQVTNPTKSDITQTDQAVNAHLLSSNISEAELGLNEGYPSCCVKLVKLEYEGSGYSQAGALMQVQATLDADLQVIDQSQKYTNATFTIDEKDKFKASVETNIKNIFSQLNVKSNKYQSEAVLEIGCELPIGQANLSLTFYGVNMGMEVFQGTTVSKANRKYSTYIVNGQISFNLTIMVKNENNNKKTHNNILDRLIVNLPLVPSIMANDNPLIIGIKLIGGPTSAF